MLGRVCIWYSKKRRKIYLMAVHRTYSCGATYDSGGKRRNEAYKYQAQHLFPQCLWEAEVSMLTTAGFSSCFLGLVRLCDLFRAWQEPSFKLQVGSGFGLQLSSLIHGDSSSGGQAVRQERLCSFFWCCPCSHATIKSRCHGPAPNQGSAGTLSSTRLQQMVSLAL